MDLLGFKPYKLARKKDCYITISLNSVFISKLAVSLMGIEPKDPLEILINEEKSVVAFRKSEVGYPFPKGRRICHTDFIDKLAELAGIEINNGEKHNFYGIVEDEVFVVGLQ